MADRYDERDPYRERDRDRGWEEHDRDRDRRYSGNRGDWGGNECGWEGSNRAQEWNPDRRGERGGLDRGHPEQNREQWGSRSSWGTGNQSRGEWDRERDYTNEGRREGGWSEGRFGGRENWSGQGSYGQQQGRESEWNRADRDRGHGYDWEHSGTWGSGQAGRYDEGRGEMRRGAGDTRSSRQYAGGYNIGSGYGGGSGAYGGGMGTQGTGRFAGRGPKGWQRSDERIRDDVNERLTHHPDVDATEIDVQVSQGVVTLSGAVDDRHARRLAEDIAEGVSGVREVQNQIRVQQQSAMTSAGHSSPDVIGGSSQKTESK
jgi:hypothetical protein